MGQLLILGNRSRIIDSEPVDPGYDDQPKMTVERWDNNIYFYSEVTTERILDLIIKIKEVEEQLLIEKYAKGNSLPIWLHIQSGGGDLFAAFSFADQKFQVPIYSIIEGYCASAATIMSLACNKRYIQPNAFMLIHQLSSIKWGKYEEFKDEMNMLTMLMNNLVKFYINHTKLTEEEIQELLKHDSWFNAEECIKKGLVDYESR